MEPQIILVLVYLAMYPWTPIDLPGGPALQWQLQRKTADCEHPIRLQGTPDTPEFRLWAYARWPDACFEYKWGRCADLFWSLCGDEAEPELSRPADDDDEGA